MFAFTSKSPRLSTFERKSRAAAKFLKNLVARNNNSKPVLAPEQDNTNNNEDIPSKDDGANSPITSTESTLSLPVDFLTDSPLLPSGDFFGTSELYLSNRAPNPEDALYPDYIISARSDFSSLSSSNSWDDSDVEYVPAPTNKTKEPIEAKANLRPLRLSSNNNEAKLKARAYALDRLENQGLRWRSASGERLDGGRRELDAFVFPEATEEMPGDGDVDNYYHYLVKRDYIAMNQDLGEEYREDELLALKEGGLDERTQSQLKYLINKHWKRVASKLNTLHKETTTKITKVEGKLRNAGLLEDPVVLFFADNAPKAAIGAFEDFPLFGPCSTFVRNDGSYALWVDDVNETILKNTQPVVIRRTTPCGA